MALTTCLPANQFPSDFALRMSQTTTSVLPFDLVSRIIKEGDGGLATHKEKFKSVLNLIDNLKYYPYADDETREAAGEMAWEITEGDNTPTLFPPVSWCTQASGELRARFLTDLELHRIDWWCPGGGGEATFETWIDPENPCAGMVPEFQPRFQAYLFH